MKDLNYYYNVAINNVKSCGIEVPYITKVYTSNTTKRLGRCSYIGSTNSYTISISKYLLDDRIPDSLILTVLCHEILHSIEGCLNHGKLWKSYANVLNKKYGYSISRQTDLRDWDISQKEINSIFHLSPKSPKYVIRCLRCKHEWNYYRKCEIVFKIETSSNYTCPYCGQTKFKVITK